MKENIEYFNIILDYIEKLKNYTDDIEFEDFLDNEEKYDACCMVLQQIGEIANKIDRKKISLANIPIDQMRWLRNRITHDYIWLDDEIIWDTIEISIPQLEKTIKNYIKYFKI